MTWEEGNDGVPGYSWKSVRTTVAEGIDRAYQAAWTRRTP